MRGTHLEVLGWILVGVVTGYGQTAPPPTEDTLKKGRITFVQYCARCHGMSGKGGAGPALNHSTLPRARTDVELVNVIKYGLPGTGMPGSWMLSDAEALPLSQYVRSLGTHQRVALRGDSTAGRAAFEKGQCGSCHIIGGVGGSLGPELSRVGLRRSPEFLRQAVQHPGTARSVDTSGFIEHLVMRVVFRNGTELRGIRVREDSFTLQLRDAQNQFHSLRKADLKELHREKNQSLMPEFKDTFDNDELEDLVAFLSNRRGGR